MKTMMFVLHLSAATLIMAILTQPREAVAQQTIDACLAGVDRLAPGAGEPGTPHPDTSAASDVAASCEAAEQSAASSVAIRFATARSLIWSGRQDAALVRLEQSIDEDPEAAELSASLCAAGLGSERVRETTCGWLFTYPPEDPALAWAAAASLLSDGRGEWGLGAANIAAKAGEPEALAFTTDLCARFDLDDPNAIATAHPGFAGMDGAYIGAVSCEAAYIGATDMSPEVLEAGLSYAAAMTFFDDYQTVAGVLLEIAETGEPGLSDRAIAAAIGLCGAFAGATGDPAIETGVSDDAVIIDRARPVCEVAAYTAPAEASMHYALARVYTFAGEDESADQAFEEAARLGHPLATAAMAASPNPGGPTPLLTSAGALDTSQFSQPDIIRAMYDGNLGILKRNRLQSLVYLESLAEALDADMALFLGFEFEIEKDPGLLPILKKRLATDPEHKMALTGVAIGDSLEGFRRGVEELMRQKDLGSGLFSGDLVESLIGVVTLGTESKAGSLTYQTQIKVVKRAAARDAKVLFGSYQSDPSVFRRVYKGLKDYTYQ